MIVTSRSLSNSDIAELLAVAAETAKMPLQKALRRASRKALFWEEEAAVLLEQSRSLAEELPGVGTSLDRIIRRWIDDPPEVPKPPELRRNFLTLTEARAILANSSVPRVNGDLQMHTVWSDGSGTIEEMARAAIDRGYEYIAITDHSKGLRIAGGINEQQLVQQSLEIEEVNSTFKAEARTFRVLRSIELNLDPRGDGDMESPSLRKLDVVLGCFHSALRKKEDQTERYLAALRNPHIQILGHPRGRIYNFRSGLMAHWERVFDLAAELDKAVEIDAYPDRLFPPTRRQPARALPASPYPSRARPAARSRTPRRRPAAARRGRPPWCPPARRERELRSSQNPTSRSISARMLAGLGSAHSISLG